MIHQRLHRDLQSVGSVGMRSVTMAFLLTSASSICTRDMVWRSYSMHFPHKYLVIFTEQNACLIACGA